jgi:hypothetical protein
VLSGLVRPLPHAYRAGLLAILASTCLLRDLQVLHFRLPEVNRQVPRTVLGRQPVAAAFQFGFELGTGVRTHLTTSAPHLLGAALILLAPAYPMAAAAGVGFGVGRAVMPLLRFASRSGDAWDERLGVQLRWLAPACSLAALLALVSLYLAG